MKCLAILLLVISCSVSAKSNRKLHTSPDVSTNRWSFQIEENFYHIENDNNKPVNSNYINAAIGYLTPIGFKVEMMTYNCPLSGGQDPTSECDTYINLTQTIDITKHWKTIIGSQNGTVFTGPTHLHNAEYGLISYQPTKKLDLHAGTYYANRSLASINVIGYTAGFVIPIHDDWKMESDYFSGQNTLSGAGINIFWTDYYFGILVPAPKSGNEFAGVLGFKFN